MLKLAAKKGHPVAQYTLGLMFETGDGVQQSNRSAFKWYKKAADQGDQDAARACETIVEKIESGTRVKKDS